MAFEELIGNGQIKKILQETILSKQFLHSYLFVGEQGVGKMLFAKEFAKHILCTNEKDANVFEQIDSNNHPDFNIIIPNGNSIKIEQIRLLQTKIIEKPILSNKKVYIIDDSQTMTKEAQNCLLKTLEEPPEYAVIILLCSNENLLLNTIQSRCTKMVFKNIAKEDLKKYIEKHELFNVVTDSLLETMEGSIGKAYKLKEKQELYESIKPIFENIDKVDKIDLITKSDILYKAKEDIQELLNFANIILAEKAKSDYRFLNCIKIIENSKNRLKQNANFDMTIDDMLFHLWEEINEKYSRS